MNDPAADADRADMQRLVAGEDAALDRLMERHAGRLGRHLFRLLQNQADAEDLAQATFVRVFEHRTRFDTARPFATWLYTIATNLVRDRFRWRSRHPETSLDDAMEPAADPRSDNQVRAGVSPSADQRLLESERAEAVRAAIAELPPELREPLVLAEFEDLPHAQIGQILGCTAKAVEVRIYRARLRLKQSLARFLA